MDELVHHCMRELAFDGDLGCDVFRLRDFVTDFFAHHAATRTQRVDDAYIAFVWVLIMQQPAVRVGIVPSGASEVWVAPQNVQKQKAKKAKAQNEDFEDPFQVSSLEIIEGGKTKPMSELVERYGASLRIAVDHETSFAAITGSHIRPSKLSDMVYSALQLIARGREHGMSVVDLGKKTGYDQKTCFYLVKQLIDLNLVVKRRQGGVGSNFCILKYFFERSPLWKPIRDEEAAAALSAEQAVAGPSGEGGMEVDDGSGGGGGGGGGEENAALPDGIVFTPIDARHLSSLPVIKGRVVKLLTYAPNHIHPSQNLLKTIGFLNPTKTDRRFFQSRIRELIEQGIIERVAVLDHNPKSTASKIPCLRLITSEEQSHGSQEQEHEEAVVQDPGVEEDVVDNSSGGFKMTVTLHKQIVDLIEESGLRGMTLNDLCTNLCNFDKRTVELLLSRLVKYPPPSHLADIGIAQVQETFGRERRFRYHTVASFRAIIEREKLQDQDVYSSIDFSNVGGFAPFSADVFWETEEERDAHVDGMKGMTAQNASKKAAGKRAKKIRDADEAGGSTSGIKPKRGKKRKLDEDEGDEAVSEPPAKKKRGRPPKKKSGEEGDASVAHEGGPGATQDVTVGEQATTPTTPAQTPAPKRRGRPPKAKAVDSPAVGEVVTDVTPVSTPATTPKRRGRPPKRKQSEVDQASASEDPPPVKKRGGPRKNATAAATAVDEDMEPTTSVNDTIRSDVEPSSSHLHGVDGAEPATVERPRPSSRPTPEHTEASALTCPDEIEEDHSIPTSGHADPSPSTRSPAILSAAEVSLDQTTQPIIDDAPSITILEPPSNVEQDPTPMDVDTNVPPQYDSDLSLSHTSAVNNPETSTQPVRAMHDIPIDPALLSEPSAEAPPASVIDSSASQPSIVSLLAGSNFEPKPRGRPKSNVSLLRRENEILRVVENYGGIANLSSKEFLHAHSTLLETMTAAGEATSGQAGIRVDKRTLDQTLTGMENKGKLKILKTSVVAPTGTSRLVRVAYLPTIDIAKVNEFVVELGRSVPVLQPMVMKTIEQPAKDPVTSASRPHRVSRLSTLITDLDSTGQPSAPEDPDAKLRLAMLTDPNVLAQLYGYIHGKALRARELHLFAIQAFAGRMSSPRIVSHDHRILSLPFFNHDIPLSMHCSVVSTLDYDADVEALFNTEEGKRTLVKDLSPAVHTSLQVGRSRARTRILNLLELLYGLKIITPLQPSTAENPAFVCGPNADHPVAFDPVPDPWTMTSLASAPVYWRFNDVAPIFLCVLVEDNPPLWKNVDVKDVDQSKAFWGDLERASLDRRFAEKVKLPASGSTTGSAEARRSIRRKSAWVSSYEMSPKQTEYLKGFTDLATGNTPLQAANSDGILQRLHRVTTAPLPVIRDFFTRDHARVLNELEKARRRAAEAKRLEELNKQAADDRNRLAEKAAHARAQKAQDWEDMVKRIHPEELKGTTAIRVGHVRAKFLQSGGKNIAKWEAEIVQAIAEARRAAETVLASASRTALPTIAPLPVATASGATVHELIAKQKKTQEPLKTPAPKKKKGKKAAQTEEPQPKAPQLRRHRFQWNREYDELLRDAVVIIKARCQSNRIEWSAIDQVFPSSPRNSLRQRWNYLREQPTAEAYLKRLEDWWHNLWMQHRGSSLLPDPDPESATNFNLVQHVEFLRKHVDKNALRVGFVQPNATVQKVELPADLTALNTRWEIDDKSANVPTWDFMWNMVVEEGREKTFLQNAFVCGLEHLPTTSEAPNDTIHVAESALKMVFGTPHEGYDSTRASALLHEVGEQPISIAKTNLLSRGILSKLVKDPSRPRPGRAFKISEINQNAIGGSISQDTFQDGAALEAVFEENEDDWREWPLLSSDGDLAALVQATSENQVDFKIDTSQPQFHRQTLEWNSKKADDDQIETALFVRARDAFCASQQVSASPPPAAEHPAMAIVTTGEHGKTAEGNTACCKLSSDGIADCDQCLRAEQHSATSSLTDHEKDIASSIMGVLHDAGAAGVPKRQFLVSLTNFSEDNVKTTIEKLVNASMPLLFSTGYSSSVVVSSAYAHQWTVTVSEDPPTKLFPRRWLDISGMKVPEVWDAALRAVMGQVVFRPGISQTELRWRLRSVYDRQEIIELLRNVQEAGFVERRLGPRQSLAYDGILQPDEEEERNIFWFLGKRHWYQI